LIAAVAVHGGTRNVEQFRDSKCGVAFSIPKNWLVVKVPNSDGHVLCVFEIRPKNLKQLMEEYDVDIYSVYLKVRRMGFDKAVPETGFAKENGEWLARGRGLDSGADVIRNMPWFGIRASVTTGCFHEKGGYAGLCEVPAALIGNKSISAELWGGPQGVNEFETVLRNFRFHPSGT